MAVRAEGVRPETSLGIERGAGVIRPGSTRSGDMPMLMCWLCGERRRRVVPTLTDDSRTSVLPGRAYFRTVAMADWT